MKGDAECQGVSDLVPGHSPPPYYLREREGDIRSGRVAPLQTKTGWPADTLASSIGWRKDRNFGYEHRWTPTNEDGLYRCMSKQPQNQLEQNYAMRRMPPAGLQSGRVVYPLELRMTTNLPTDHAVNGMSRMSTGRFGGLRKAYHYVEDDDDDGCLEGNTIRSPTNVTAFCEGLPSSETSIKTPRNIPLSPTARSWPWGMVGPSSFSLRKRDTGNEPPPEPPFSSTIRDMIRVELFPPKKFLGPIHRMRGYNQKEESGTSLTQRQLRPLPESSGVSYLPAADRMHLKIPGRR